MNHRQRNKGWPLYPGEPTLRVITGLILGIILFILTGPFVSGVAALSAIAILLVAALLARTSWAGLGWLLGGLLIGTALAEAIWLVWFILAGGINGD